MDFDSVNRIYASPPRRERRQNQTYCTPYPKHSNDNGEPLLESAKTQSSAQSSIRLARGINLTLLSRISKFEALDALSMPIKLQSLRPAHLRLSRNSSTFKWTETSNKKMLSAIFSPSNESQNQYTRIEDGFTSEQHPPVSPKSIKWFSPKKVHSKMLPRSETSNNSAKVKMCGDVPDRTEASESKGVDTVAFEDMLNETPARKKTFGEIIKLYDRSSDKIVSKGNALFGMLSLTNEALGQCHRKGMQRAHLLPCPLRHKLFTPLKYAQTIPHRPPGPRTPVRKVNWIPSRMLPSPHRRKLANPLLLSNGNPELDHKHHHPPAILILHPQDIPSAVFPNGERSVPEKVSLL